MKTRVVENDKLERFLDGRDEWFVRDEEQLGYGDIDMAFAFALGFAMGLILAVFVRLS